MYRSWFFAGAAMVALLASEAKAEVPLTGFFIAREACPALQSIRNATNPGDIKTAPGKSYPLIAKNKPNASHYFIEVEGADPARRWVAVDCGEHVVSADGSSQPQASGFGEERDSDPTRAEYVLSVSWQPAFCETKRDKAECATQTPNRFDATHFTLHGLWPQPRRNAYCDVPPEMSLADKDGDWDRLPEPKLSDATRQRLAQVMPGTQSNLERHEWIKHGTCFHADFGGRIFLPGDRAHRPAQRIEGARLVCLQRRRRDHRQSDTRRVRREFRRGSRRSGSRLLQADSRTQLDHRADDRSCRRNRRRAFARQSDLSLCGDRSRLPRRRGRRRGNALTDRQRVPAGQGASRAGYSRRALEPT